MPVHRMSLHIELQRVSLPLGADANQSLEDVVRSKRSAESAQTTVLMEPLYAKLLPDVKGGSSRAARTFLIRAKDQDIATLALLYGRYK